MFFEAESNDNKYLVTLSESRTHWKIAIKKNEHEWEKFSVDKTAYKSLDHAISFMFNGQSYLIDVVGHDTDYTVYTRGSYRTIKIFNDEMLLHESLKSGKALGGADNLMSGMPGKIVKVFVKPGDEVKENDPLLIMEAMKMENEMRAEGDVVIKDIHVEPGDNVDSGTLLISYE